MFGDNLVLYRGDSTKIAEFDYHKTDKWCLFGKGVYLTNSFAVANSYRSKGYRGRDRVIPSQLFSGKADDRKDAMNKAFATYIDCVYAVAHGLSYKELRGDRRRAHEIKAREEYEQDIKDGKVKADYTGYAIKGRRPPTLIVRYECDYTMGFVTEFAFPRRPFEQSIVKIDGKINDRTFWEIIYDRGVNFGNRVFTSRDEFIHYNCGTIPESDSMPHTVRSLSRLRGRAEGAVIDSIRAAIQPYGYLGFEYNGGTYQGGLGLHRAFVVWDSDYVNNHKTRRITANVA